jgi:Domain of unknown function (DUF4372)/Transposase DDE domain
MNQVSSIFNQILRQVPRVVFDDAVTKHNAERHARGFRCWDQFVAMLFCQIGHAKSLREISGGLASCEGKLTHLGMKGSPSRSTLAYANEHRPWQLYQTVFEQLRAWCEAEAHTRQRKFRFKHKLVSLDSTTIPLALSMFDWAAYQRAKGAAKIHMVLNHDGYMPQFAVVTDGKKSDIEIAKTLSFEPGTMLVFDRGYTDYDWWLHLSRGKVNFVTRLKDCAAYTIIEQRPVGPLALRVIRDELILLDSQTEIGPAAKLRRIEVLSDDGTDTVVFVTNNLTLAATTIAAIYRDRWKIELFFKAIKQSLKIRTFVGTSENAVQVQIWTALIAMLLIKMMQWRASHNWSLSNLIALLRQQLFVYRPLQAWLDNPFAPPPVPTAADDGQLVLRWA